MTADYQITENIQVYGKIENLGDKYYQSVYGYATSPRAFYIGVRGKI
jgi:vitamin B12 transporter